MSISSRVLQTTILPLRLIFWGGLICVFDITVSGTVNGNGWKFDILNDFVGMLLITWGVYQLGQIHLHDRYRNAMRFVMVIAILSCLEALHEHLIYDTPPLVSFVLAVFGVLAMIATVVFCVAMRWLCSKANLHRAERSWQVTQWLFVFIYLIPLGLFYLAGAIAIATGSSFNINLGPVGLLLLPLFFVPLIHLFVSTSRMKADVERNVSIGPQDTPLDENPTTFHPCQ